MDQVLVTLAFVAVGLGAVIFGWWILFRAGRSG